MTLLVIPTMRAFPDRVPRNGQHIELPNKQGSWWEFVYDSSITDAYKWVFIGGADLSNYIATDEAESSAPFVDLATVGPTVTTPYSGIYECFFGEEPYLASGSLATSQVGVVRQRAAVFTLMHAIDSYLNFIGVVADGTATGMFTPLTAVAGDEYRLRYANSAGAATSSRHRKRWISIPPKRIIGP